MAAKDFSVDDIINEYSGKTHGKPHEEENLDLDAIIGRLEGHSGGKSEEKPHVTGTKTEVIEDVLEIGDNSYAFTPPEESEPSQEEAAFFEPSEPAQIREASESVSKGGELSETAVIFEKLSAPLNIAPDTNPDIEIDGLRKAKKTEQGTDVLERVLDGEESKPSANARPRAEQDMPKVEEQPSSPKDKTSKITPVEEAVKRSQPPVRPIHENGSNTAIMEGLLKLKKERGGSPKRRDQNASPVNRASIDDIELDIDSKILPNTEIGLEEGATEEERLAYLNAKRRERVKQFVIASDEEEEKPQKKNDVADFMNFEQAKEMASNISSLKANLVVRLCVLLITGIISAYVTFANDVGLPLIELLSKSENQGMPYLFVNVILGLAACFFSYTVLAVGFKKLVTLKADSDSIAAVSMLLSMASGIALLTDTELVQLSTVNIYICVSIIGLLVNTVGKLLIVTRTERNFRYVSGGYSKYAVMRIDDEDIASKFTKGALTDFPSLATSRKTEFVSDFIKNSYSADMTDAFCKYYAPIITVISLIVGVIAAILHPDTINTGTRMLLYGLAGAAGTCAICSAAGMMLVTNIPLAKASKKYLQASAVMLGYSAVDTFADTNSILIDAIDLFPDGMVEIINIKPAKKTPIEDGIIYAASLCCQTESILRPTFYKMIKGKTEMLYPVESYLYEDGLGLLGWIQNKRVLFGNRALMESHSIEGLPSPEKEAQYAKEDSSLQYLSIGGSLAMIFVVKLKGSVSVIKALRDLERQNITVILRSVDSLLSITRIAELFGVAPNMFKLLPFRYHNEYDEQTSYIEKMSSPMVYSGHFASLAMLLTGVKRLRRSAGVGVGVQLLSAVLGVILSTVLTLVGVFTGVMTGSAVLFYVLVFALLTAIVQALAKT